ncbi:MAG: DUF3052 family protein [Solirubrobacterales bacterium]|nr:DUF3052 family protein [Solirubrobacterales bacterium]
MDLAGKLQLKTGQSMAVVAQPESVSLEFGSDHSLADAADQADGVLVFCHAREDLERLSDQFVAPAKRDTLTWVAYPKAGKLGTDLNRDILADLVKAHGVQPVRQVALDDTWSALRLRPA